jgi:lysophospholipase L1-like esterase
VPGVAVTFSVGSGGGTLTGSNAVTDAFGIGRLGSWRLGPTPGAQTVLATATGLQGSPLTFNAQATAAPTAPDVQIVTFGDSNTDLGFSGSNATPMVASYVSAGNPAIRLSPTAPNSALQTAGKIEARWKATTSRTIKVTNHGITGTNSGSGRQVTGAPHALEQVGGISRFRGEVLGDAYPWNGAEPTNDHYPWGSVSRVQAFVPRTSDFVLVSFGTNDIYEGVPPATIAANISTMISVWTGRGLPANKFILTTVTPRAPSQSANIPDLNARIRALAASTGVRLIDLAAYTSVDGNGLTWKPGYYTVGNELHYTEAVRDWLADQVVTYMLSF